MREGLHKIVCAEETIVAIATPWGHSGIGVIRVSGRDALAIAKRYFKPRSGKPRFDHRVAMLGTWCDSAGDQVDEVIITVFRGPHSYTGEDIVEISAHGNPLALRRIVNLCCTNGSRLASPGEFTLRAVSNGKMDLIQAEAVREFIDAQTEQQSKTALRQMEGSLSKHIQPVKTKLVEVIAHLEAGIDFAEDDVNVPGNTAVTAAIRPVLGQLQSLQETFGFGRMLSRGLQLVILGKPNVGKSSVFNRLVSEDRAIVTDIPGTTRDVLKESVSLDGVPLCFADTAGIRETTDCVESIGVERTFQALADADLALVVVDGSMVLDENDRKALMRSHRIPHVILVNKMDLPQAIDVAALNGTMRVAVSAKTGEGFDRLYESLRAFLLAQKPNLADDLILTNARQHAAIEEAASAVGTSLDALKSSVPHEMVLLDLYRALGALDELTGEVVTEDILDKIFSTFCVGK